MKYVIRQGDTVTRLAWQRGLDASAILDLSENAELRDARRDRDILAPGDVLHLPDSFAKPLPVRSGSSNRYAASIPKVTVRLVLKDGDSPGAPSLSSEPYVIEGAGEPIEGVSDDNGRVEVDLPVHVREVTLMLVRKDVAIPVMVGDLDPEIEASGARQRLQNLGFLSGSSSRAFQSGLKRFQRSAGIAETGVLDEATAAALRTAHDCGGG